MHVYIYIHLKTHTMRGAGPRRGARVRAMARTRLNIRARDSRDFGECCQQ